MTQKKLEGAGLRGQIAGKTSICTVAALGHNGLTYYGYDVEDLAENCEFEEVAYLLFHGELPNATQLKDYKNTLANNRDLPQPLKEVLERIPASAHPMDVLRTGVSMLGNLETENSFDEQQSHADRLLAALPGIICYWYRFSHDGVRVDLNTGADSIGGHFLHLLHDKAPSELHEKVMHISLILYAEHEFNASTFTARVCASTLSDFHSCITGAIGSLRGPLHGGANEAAMDMIENWQSPEEAEKEILGMLTRKEKIMGFGHAVYTESDPRNTVIKKWSKQLSESAENDTLYQVSLRCEEVMWREKKLFCNADFFHASTYFYMNIPTKLFTPIFVMSRTSGWAAHVFEQRADNRIIRPNAEYIGPGSRKVSPISER
ncbi:MAG: 2-methylcitrate synthase [Cellvibrionaceae bacterium]